MGGGPAGSSLLVRAMRLGVMDELCSGGLEEGGVCMLDSDTNTRFGGGRLQDYQIRSNTWADKFYTNVIESKPENRPSESIENTILEELVIDHDIDKEKEREKDNKDNNDKKDKKDKNKRVIPITGSAAGKELAIIGESEAPLSTSKLR